MKPTQAFNELDEKFLLDLLLNHTDEAIVIVDKDGLIVKLSESYADFLGVDREASIGRHVTDVIENTRMHIVMRTKQSEYAQPQLVNGHQMVASRFPIIRNGEVLGALGRVVFKNVSELKNVYKRIEDMERELDFYKNKFGRINYAKYSVEDLIGDSETMQSIKEMIVRVAKSNSNILILGESGTGKELFAHAIHAASKRVDKPLICLNCASIPANLMESELFGYEEGAFTGSRKGGKQGLFHAANKGTLFLDEIGDLPLDMQVKLLRVLQEKEVRKIGASAGEKIDVRIVAATNRDLAEMIRQGEFRSDLYYRLNVVNLTIPPLRERMEDIPALAEYILWKLTEKEGICVKGISADAMEMLWRYDWPGNVRELENALERAANFVDDDAVIKAKHLNMRFTEKDDWLRGRQLKEILEQTERMALIAALERQSYCKRKVADELGICRTSLYEKLQKYGIEKPVKCQ